MASNYEQPKLATSKQYNVSQGNIGQVKQQNVDWTDYESAKIWEAVANGVVKVDKSVQADARLRGQLDETAGLIAENSWWAQKSYDQGRAVRAAEVAKISFAEQTSKLAADITKNNGTMEDFNKAMLPLYQELIKNIRTVGLTDIDGNPLSVDMEYDLLQARRKETLTLAVEAQKTFSKYQEAQMEADREITTSTTASQVTTSLMTTPDHSLIQEKLRDGYKKIRYVQPDKAKADAAFVGAIEYFIANANALNPVDVLKVQEIKNYIDSPDAAIINPVAKMSISKQLDTFKKDTQGESYYLLQGQVRRIVDSVHTGTYNLQEVTAMTEAITQAYAKGIITQPQASSLQDQLNNISNEAVATARDNNPEQFLNYSLPQINAKFGAKGNPLEEYAKKVWDYFSNREGTTIGKAYEDYSKFVTGKFPDVKEFRAYGDAKLGGYLKSVWSIDGIQKETLETTDQGTLMLEMWPMLAGKLNDPKVSREEKQAIIENMPENFKSQANTFLLGGGQFNLNFVQANDLLVRMVGDAASVDAKEVNKQIKFEAADFEGSWLKKDSWSGSVNDTALVFKAVNKGVREDFAIRSQALWNSDKVQAEIAVMFGSNFVAKTPAEANSVLMSLGYIRNIGSRIVFLDSKSKEALFSGTGFPEDVGNALLLKRLKDNYLSSKGVAGDINDIFMELRDGRIIYRNSTTPQGKEYEESLNDVIKEASAIFASQVQNTQMAQVQSKAGSKPLYIDYDFIANSKLLKGTQTYGNRALAAALVDTIFKHENITLHPITHSEGTSVIGLGVYNKNPRFGRMVELGKIIEGRAAGNKASAIAEFTKLQSEVLLEHLSDSLIRLQNSKAFLKPMNTVTLKGSNSAQANMVLAVADAGWIGGDKGSKRAVAILEHFLLNPNVKFTQAALNEMLLDSKFYQGASKNFGKTKVGGESLWNNDKRVNKPFEDTTTRNKFYRKAFTDYIVWQREQMGNPVPLSDYNPHTWEHTIINGYR